MDQMELLELALIELGEVVADISETEMDRETNCGPWTVRRLASHALNNQLLWGGAVTGQDLVSIEVTMGAEPYDGDLGAFADHTAQRALAMWRRAGVLDAIHTTPFGDLPGSVVIGFPTIDALAHAWDLSVSVGRPIEFAVEAMPAISTLVEAVCTDDVRALGLIASPTEPAADATDTEVLMALAGREVPR